MRAVYVVVLASLLLGGCETLKELVGPGEAPKVDTELSQAAQIAQQSINEANLTITAAANVIGSNAESGVMTKGDAQAALDQVKEFRKQAIRAQELLDLGDIGTAKTQAELVSKLAAALQKRVAEEARKAK